MSDFLRRIGRARYVAPQALSHEAFMCREQERKLSLTLITPEVAENSFYTYWTTWKLPSGDRPGLCSISGPEINTAKLGAPVLDQRPDESYGDLHHSLVCPDELAAQFLAARAFERGIHRPYLKAREIARLQVEKASDAKEVQ